MVISASVVEMSGSLIQGLLINQQSHDQNATLARAPPPQVLAPLLLSAAPQPATLPSKRWSSFALLPSAVRAIDGALVEYARPTSSGTCHTNNHKPANWLQWHISRQHSVSLHLYSRRACYTRQHESELEHAFDEGGRAHSNTALHARRGNRQAHFVLQHR